MSACAFEYDPYNKLRHTDYWYEDDVKAEWPVSKNTEWEEEPRPGDPFDYDAQPNRFYFEVESVGQLPARDIVLQGINVLHEKLALLIQDLKAGEGGAATMMDDPYAGAVDMAWDTNQPAATTVAEEWGTGGANNTLAAEWNTDGWQ